MILGIDVGGTHTDAVLIDHGKVIKKSKVVTNSDNLLLSLTAATNEIMDNTIIPQLERIVLSTTLSTNAIVQNKIDRVGLMVISGPGLPHEALNVFPDTRFLSGYINHRGKEMAPINPKEAESSVAYFFSQGIRHIGIVGKFSTRNPQHEIELKKTVNNIATHVTLGHGISGHLNFPRRIATTCLNEAIFDLYQDFAGQVLDFAKRRGINIPIYILKADGGVLELSQSLEFPVQTILSGPAASIMGIIATTECNADSIALDIGGTTTDIALFADGVPLLESFGVAIEGKKTLIRGLRTRSIGVGGDSVVKIENGKMLIGPNREGPAAALGGPFPTPTDAMIVLGITTIGEMKKAADSLIPIAELLHCDVREAAQKIFRETCRKIASASIEFLNDINNMPVYTIHEMITNKKIEPRLVCVVGGPAQAMAPEIARLLNCEARIPFNYEIANAIGAALARTTAELTILADTEQRILTIAEEGLQTPIPANFTIDDAIRIGREKLTEKIIQSDKFTEKPEIEVVESQEFNIVDEFYTVGKNIRVKVQVKPGSITMCR
jgi:N-methylhydantoinase A/oxoprolinase/acetone carboxylase beta subunit